LNKREREIATVKTNSIEQQINNEKKKKHLKKKKKKNDMKKGIM